MVDTEIWLNNCINIKFPIFDNCTVVIQFLDDISNQLIFSYGRFRNLSLFESSMEGEEKNGLVFSIVYKY